MLAALISAVIAPFLSQSVLWLAAGQLGLDADRLRAVERLAFIRPRSRNLHLDGQAESQMQDWQEEEERTKTMLELRPQCEHCAKPLPPGCARCHDLQLRVHLFCAACVPDVLHNVCPNCGGGFTQRPARPKQDLKNGNCLANYPAATNIKHRPVDPVQHGKFAAPIPEHSTGAALAGCYCVSEQLRVVTMPQAVHRTQPDLIRRRREAIRRRGRREVD